MVDAIIETISLYCPYPTEYDQDTDIGFLHAERGEAFSTSEHLVDKLVSGVVPRLKYTQLHRLGCSSAKRGKILIKAWLSDIFFFEISTRGPLYPKTGIPLRVCKNCLFAPLEDAFFLISKYEEVSRFGFLGVLLRYLGKWLSRKTFLGTPSTRSASSMC